MYDRGGKQRICSRYTVLSQSRDLSTCAMWWALYLLLFRQTHLLRIYVSNG